MGASNANDDLGCNPAYPGCNTHVMRKSREEIEPEYIDYLADANLDGRAETETWEVVGSNFAINYSTHGAFRYFGKFPAPIARELIKDYSKPRDLVVDPACGSGTTGVEALWHNRPAELFDINPVATLISAAKTTYISRERLENAMLRFESNFKRCRTRTFETNEIDLEHWFLPETVSSLARIRECVNLETKPDVAKFMQAVFISTIRRASKATTQQGRLFLDVDTAIQDAYPVFMKNAAKAIDNVASLPAAHSSIHIETANLLEPADLREPNATLVIYHPPYFNAYKYSSINSLELAWLEISRKSIRQNEIREFFKVGKPENAETYIDDMVTSIKHSLSLARRGGKVVMMIGDALMQGRHIPVTAEILDRIGNFAEVERIALRIPRHTEATWASSQRRNSSKLGVVMFDYLVTLTKRPKRKRS